MSDQMTPAHEPAATPGLTDELDYLATQDAAAEQFAARGRAPEQFAAYYTGWADAIHNVRHALAAERTTEAALLAERDLTCQQCGAQLRVRVDENSAMCFSGTHFASRRIYPATPPPAPQEAGDAG